jgi:hypothetical protein
MNERSILQVRQRDHFQADRKGELVIEVIRDGIGVATIYGSREGIHITSERFGNTRNRPFPLPVEIPAAMPSIVVPLLDEREECPWCRGTGSVGLLVTADAKVTIACPICEAGCRA